MTVGVFLFDLIISETAADPELEDGPDNECTLAPVKVLSTLPDVFVGFMGGNALNGDKRPPLSPACDGCCEALFESAWEYDAPLTTPLERALFMIEPCGLSADSVTSMISNSY